MAISFTRPGVRIRQLFQAVAAARALPTLPLTIIGQLRHVRPRQLVGDYSDTNTGAFVSAPVPGLGATETLDRRHLPDALLNDLEGDGKDLDLWDLQTAARDLLNDLLADPAQGAQFDVTESTTTAMAANATHQLHHRRLVPGSLTLDRTAQDTPIAGVTLTGRSADAATGETLAFTAAGTTLAWADSAAVDVSAGGTFLLDSTATGKGTLTVSVDAGSLPGADTSTPVTRTTLVEATAYQVNHELGQVTFLLAQSQLLTTTYRFLPIVTAVVERGYADVYSSDALGGTTFVRVHPNFYELTATALELSDALPVDTGSGIDVVRVDDPITFDVDTKDLDDPQPLPSGVAFQNVRSVTVQNLDQSVTYQGGGVDYAMANGQITRVGGGAITAGQSVLVSFTADYPVPPKVYLSYAAIRSDLTEPRVITSDDRETLKAELTLTDTDFSPANPLIFAAEFALPATTQAVLLMPVTADTVAAHQAAADALTKTEDPYFLVPLTMDPAILKDVWLAHAVAESTPERAHWRVALGSGALDANVRLFPDPDATAIPTDVVYGDTVLDPATNQLTDNANATGDATAIQAGDVVEVIVGPNLGRHPILNVNVVGPTITYTLEPPPGGFVANAATGNRVAYRVRRLQTPGQQATALAARATGFGHRRAWLFWPDLVVVADPAGGTKTVPGFFRALLVGALRSGLPPQQPLTNLPTRGLIQLLHSNTTFTPAQLDTMAAGGWDVGVQGAVGGDVRSLQQLTTDRSSLTLQEQTTTTSVDAAAKFYHAVMKEWFGRINVNETTLQRMSLLVEGLTEDLVNLEAPGVGGIIRDGQLERFAETATGIQFCIRIVPPKVGNTLDLDLLI